MYEIHEKTKMFFVSQNLPLQRLSTFDKFYDFMNTRNLDEQSSLRS